MPFDLTFPRRPWLLAGSLLLAGFVALSIHVGMLASGVPFPLPEPPRVAVWLHQSLVCLGLLCFLRLAEPRLGRRSVLTRIVVVFLVLLGLQETFRVAIMTSVVTGGWEYSVLALVKPLIRCATLASLCVVLGRWVRGGKSLFMIALAAGALATVAQTLVNLAFAPVMQHFAGLARGDLYAFPYPFHVTVSAYVSFIEALAGGTLMAALAWDGLPGSRPIRLLVLGGLAALIKGVVGGTFVYGFFTGGSVWIGMFSWSQFLLEFLALGILIGVALEMFAFSASSRLSEADGRPV